MSHYDDICRPVATLEKGLNINELMKDSGLEFEFTPEDNDEEESCSTDVDFNFDEVQQKLDNWDVIDVDENEDGVDCSPFDKYRRKMTDLTDDGKLKKFIVKPGTGDLVVENSTVFLRYQAYVEYVETPFDSTLLQGQGEKNEAAKFNLARGDLITGLHNAVLTMRKGEKAEFLIHHDLAYGQLGCPPRIPPEATVLFVVELDSFIDTGAAYEVDVEDDGPPEERNKFSKVYKKAKALHQEGLLCYSKQQNYSQAAQKFRIVINMLHNARLADEEEEKVRNKFLLKLYTNCSICYDKLKLYKKVCIMATDAVKVNQQEAMKNAKLLFYWGRAKMYLGDYFGARKHLMNAQKLEPRDKLIGDTILELVKREESSKTQEKIMWQRACNFSPAAAKIKELSKEEEEFRDTMTQQLEEFKSSPNRDMTLTWRMTSEEEDTVLQLAKDLKLYARIADGERRVVQIKKPNVD